MENRNHKIAVGAIIQARMGSTRLPGKVLEDIAGKSALWHLINRLKFSKKIDEIILAIPDNRENNVLEKFAEENRIKYFRGSENDVLLRYFKAAEKFKADKVARITSDCPLIDPEIVDLVLKEHFKTGADFTANFFEGQKCKSIERTFPKGLELEVFNFAVLKKANELAKEHHQREHVDPYIFENPEVFRIAVVKNNENLSHFNWAVDEPKDLELVREIYKKLYKQGEIFFMKDIIGLFNKSI